MVVPGMVSPESKAVARATVAFQARYVVGRAVNPITKTNWEGTGVKPDVAVAADDALATAHKLARQTSTARKPTERQLKPQG